MKMASENIICNVILINSTFIILKIPNRELYFQKSKKLRETDSSSQERGLNTSLWSCHNKS